MIEALGAIVGAISGLSSVIGVIVHFIHVGRKMGQMEQQLSDLRSRAEKLEAGLQMQGDRTATNERKVYDLEGTTRLLEQAQHFSKETMHRVESEIKGAMEAFKAEVRETLAQIRNDFRETLAELRKE